jgi:hypothetical protein
MPKSLKAFIAHSHSQDALDRAAAEMPAQPSSPCRPTSANLRPFIFAARLFFRSPCSCGQVRSRPTRPVSDEKFGGPIEDSGSHMTHCWREMDSNLYGAFPVKRLFGLC